MGNTTAWGCRTGLWWSTRQIVKTPVEHELQGCKTLIYYQGVRLAEAANRTWEDCLDVPGHDGVEEGVEQHEADGGSQAVVVFLHGTGQQVCPLDAYALLLKQGKVLAAKAKGHRGQQALHVGESKGENNTINHRTLSHSVSVSCSFVVF